MMIKQKEKEKVDLEAQEIKKYKENPIYFIENVFNIKLFNYQKEFIKKVLNNETRYTNSLRSIY